MHELLLRLYKAQSAGLTGNGRTYTEFLLEHILQELLYGNYPTQAVHQNLADAVAAAEADRAERERKIR